MPSFVWSADSHLWAAHLAWYSDSQLSVAHVFMYAVFYTWLQERMCTLAYLLCTLVCIWRICYTPEYTCVIVLYLAPVTHMHSILCCIPILNYR